MFIKKIIKKLSIAFIATSLIPSAMAMIPDAPDVKAKSYVLMEYETGKVLKELNPDKKLAPASLTKVMTAYVVFNELKTKNLKMTDTVRISKKSWKTMGSKTYVKVGDDVLVEDLVKGMIIHSGNDASVALAEHIAGNVEGFSTLMNYQAKQLGMNNSHFKNPTGLPMSGHYTTAMDLSILTRAMIKNFPEYYYIYQLQSFTYADITQSSRNRLLKEDLGFDGLKTGFTNKAGYCYIGSSKRGESRLIVTLMGEPSPKQRFEDAKSLVNYGFRFFETHLILQANKGIKELTTNVEDGKTENLYIGAKDDVMVVLEKGQMEKIKYDASLIEKGIAPIKEGMSVGKIKVMLDDKIIAESELITLNKIDEATFFEKFGKWLTEFLGVK